MTPPAQPKVSKSSVNYRTGNKYKCCGNCVMFFQGSLNKPGECTLVRGPIMPNMLCDRWHAK